MPTENLTFLDSAGEYIFTWQEEKLTARVSRIHANSERTTCNLLFTTSHEDYAPHLLQTTFNLTSSRARSELAKEMATRYKEVVEWKNLLEQLAAKTLLEYEKGEPIVELWSSDEPVPLRYLIDPIVPLGKPTVLFGEPAAGKSQIAVILAIVMALPWYDNLLQLGAPDTCNPALFLDYEGDAEDTQRLLHHLQNGLKLGPLPLYYRRCYLPLTDDIAQVRSYIAEKNIKCLIIDSISLASRNDLNKMDAATSYFRALRQIKTTSISLAHTSKEQETERKTILGSVLFEAGARSVWEVIGTQEPGDKFLDVMLKNTKSNLSARAKPLGYRFSYGENETTIEWHDPKDIGEFVARMSLNQRVLIALKEGKMSTEELTGRLGSSRPKVDVAVSRLRKAGRITGDSKGWGLLYEEEI